MNHLWNRNQKHLPLGPDHTVGAIPAIVKDPDSGVIAPGTSMAGVTPDKVSCPAGGVTTSVLSIVGATPASVSCPTVGFLVDEVVP